MIILRNKSSFKYKPMSSEIITKYKSSENMLRHCRWDKNSEGIAIFKEDLLVGYIVWSKEDNEIKALEVIKEYRGNGLAKDLLQKALEKGINRLTVNKKNNVAISLYESLGFKVWKETPAMLFMKNYK